MTAKEKAKRYEEALGKARQLCAYPTSKPFISDLQDLFPELKEGEDERFRRYILDVCDECISAEQGLHLSIDTTKKLITWLEKQSEKPHGKSALEAIKEEKADNDIKSKPKFKVGQWIVWQDKCYKVNYNGCGYELVDQNGLSTSLEYGTIDENAHIWDITKDAKDGDILASKRTSCVLIFKGRDGTSFISYYNTSIDNNDDWNRVNFLPATKKQRDFLFAQMKKDGYKWDVNNKQLIKL